MIEAGVQEWESLGMKFEAHLFSSQAHLEMMKGIFPLLSREENLWFVHVQNRL